MWHNHQRGPFTRGGRFDSRSRLTQLYNDTKLSYENAKNSTTNPQFDDDPQVINLKKAFQVQQDRLLAWGMHWADKQAGGSRSSKGGHEVNIDEKVDQAGLGDIVATIMENIKNLLAESGRLQHPGRWNESLHTRGRGGFRSMSSEKFGLPVSGKQQEEWKEFEITTGQTLLDKLSSNIDLLYELGQAEQSSSGDAGSTKWEQERKWQEEQPQPWAQETGVVADKLVMEPEVLKSMSVSDLFEPAGANANKKQAVAALQNHGLYVDFARLEAMHDPHAASDLPSYEDSKANPVTLQGRSVYFFRQIGMHVLVDLVKASDSSLLHMATTIDDPIKQMHELANKISGKGLLTWDGHLKLIGFTLVDANTQFGFVYALPAPSDPTALQSCQTLTNSIAATFDHEQSMPPLENKIKLAYNLALTSVGYLAQNECHGHIRPSNVVFFRENDNPRLGHTLRCPYLLQPIQNVAGATEVNASASFYHHPQADVVGYGVTPAYDVYSVGLLLLEIGLWRPLSTFWKPKYDKDVFHERLRKLYVPKLASKCGTRYSRIVESCLSAPEELQERPTPVDAAEYLLHLVEALAQCCGIDEEGPPSELDIDVFEALIEQQRMNGPLPAKGPMLPPRTQSAPALASPPPLTKQASVSSKVKQKPAEALKKWPDLDIPQDHLETWNKMLMPRLSKMLQGIMKDAQESCSVSLMMIGTTPEKAKTTICVQCKDTTRVREKLCAKFKPKSGWGLVICPGDVRRSGQIRSKKHKPNARRSGASAADEGEKPAERPREQRFQKFPSCGASIGAFKDDQHLPPVSYGGTILIAGQPYGMTVHHMLEDNDEDEEDYDETDPSAQMRSIAPLTPAGLSLVSTEQSMLNSEENIAAALDDLELYDDSTDDVDSDDESDASTIRPDYAIMDGEGNEFFIMGDDDDDESVPDLDDDDDFSDEDEDDTGSVGDRPGYEAGRYDDEDCCVTQPSIDDFADDYWPDMEDRDSDHLLSHSFGLVYASSGLKRTTRNNIKHEIDWALIKINDDRMNPLCVPEDVARASEKRKGSSSSKLRSSSRHLAKEPTLTGVTPVDALGKLRVTSIGRTSGRKNGRISQAMSLLKLPGRTSFSWSYSVEGGAGVRGDSGAWLYSDERKELCGHIVGWSNALSCGYLVPMEIMFDDLKQTLDCEDIILPGMRAPAIPAEQTRLISRKAVPDSAANRGQAKENLEFRNPTTPPPTEPAANVPYITSRASRLPAAFSSTNCPPNRKGTQERWEDTIRTLRLDTQQTQQECQKDDPQEDNSPSSATGRRSAAPRRQGGRSMDIYDVVRKGSASFPSSINPIPS